MSDEYNNQNIALIKQDITYIKDDMVEIKMSLKIMLENYMPRSEVEGRLKELQKQIDTRFEGTYVQIGNKANQTEVDKINDNLSKVVWFVVLAFLGALASLVLR